nr:MAG TPA: hypothetical protein [Caudoviricetes sp.]
MVWIINPIGKVVKDVNQLSRKYHLYFNVNLFYLL